MYSQTDLDKLNALLKQFFGRLALFLAIPFLAIVASLIWRISVLGHVAAVVFAVVFCIEWFAVGAEINKYRKLVRDILTSNERSAEGTVSEIERDLIHRDGTTFLTIQLEVQEATRQGTYLRTVFFDTQKGDFPASVGQKVNVLLFDNVVKGVSIFE